MLPTPLQTLTVLLVLNLPLQLCAAEPENTLKVMSYNIRFGSAEDGENSWDYRRKLVAETIRNFKPDILGTQETEFLQKDYLMKALPDYTAFGAGRNDGKQDGEMVPIFYRTDRFMRIDGGHFWLSETPNVAGSKSWDSSLPRMTTWVRLRDRDAPGKPIIWVFNTHLDHRGKKAREESARLLFDRISAIRNSPDIIITGDFNAGEDSPPYTQLFAKYEGEDMLRDAYRLAHPEKMEDETTFNGFLTQYKPGERIDWVGISSQFEVQSATINRIDYAGRIPSDHFPVEVELKYVAEEK